MPFFKIRSGKNKGKYRSPSGRIWTKKQVALYHASDGFEHMKKKRRRRRK